MAEIKKIRLDDKTYICLEDLIADMAEEQEKSNFLLKGIIGRFIQELEKLENE